MSKILLFLLFPVLSFSQSEKVCVERYILEKAANKLDSFEVSKKIQEECLRFKDSCFALISMHNDIMNSQESIIVNQRKQITNLEGVELEYSEILQVNDSHIQYLKKEKKKLKTKYTLSLVGGGVLTVGLTTALLISLL